ncbi:hypothetical protein BS329_20495 [Amycolatopsis coloradensis]|uniref:Beta-hydroxyacyl-ACP dehydratase n=1 Tax=Amycolatopsis coloradensis TaxID=76021 RepID=A0A1R0KQW0_9PSEU|nr:hypothetical protein [Amycolatopsis coloradensis]OLZ50013.1 hypothetical protein BS329_20495 [Amycolatopsis coloradensis]
MIGAAGIRRVLPHRYPMLLVDRVLELNPGRDLVAQKAISCNEPWYSRLGEDLSEMDMAYPGVLLMESWAQSAGVLAAATRPDTGGVMLAGSMSDIEFFGSARPGDVVENHVRLRRELPDAAIFEGAGVVGGRELFTVGAMVLAFRPAEVLRSTENEVKAGERR